MGLVVVTPGVFTTVQDRGRPGYREWGVPVGGSFDGHSADLANALVGNDPNCAVLEMTLVGGVFEARCPLALAVAGAPMTVRIAARAGRDRTVGVPASFSVEPGDQIRIGGTPWGVRTYLAVAGGWLTPLVLGSRSSEVRLAAGETVAAREGTTRSRSLSEPTPAETAITAIRVMEGPDRLPRALAEAWFEAVFRAGRSADRMGIRLEGPTLDFPDEKNRLSAPVAPGAIQVAGGQPLILGVACGTMGGYPHVAQVISADLDRVGQLRPAEAIHLVRVSTEEARQIDRSDRAQRSAEILRIRTAAGDRGGAELG